MGDLIAFLRARYDEDAAAAKRVESRWRQIGETGVIVALDGTHAEECAKGNWTGIAEHIVRHDPVRVLAEIDVKRGIVDAYEDAATEFKDIGPGMVSYDRMVGSVSSLRTAIEFLSLAYASHPDYQDMWRP